jgi:hypothetical protein
LDVEGKRRVVKCREKADDLVLERESFFFLNELVYN